MGPWACGFSEKRNGTPHLHMDRLALYLDRIELEAEGS